LKYRWSASTRHYGQTRTTTVVEQAVIRSNRSERLFRLSAGVCLNDRPNYGRYYLPKLWKHEETYNEEAGVTQRAIDRRDIAVAVSFTNFRHCSGDMIHVRNEAWRNELKLLSSRAFKLLRYMARLSSDKRDDPENESRLCATHREEEENGNARCEK